MAGETTQASRAQAANYPTISSSSRNTTITVRSEHEVVAGELELADVIEMVRLPKNAVIVDGYVACDDLDSGGIPALDFSVGITGDDPDGCITETDIGQAGGKKRFDGAYMLNEKKLSAEDTIDVVITTAAATGAAGTLTLVVTYYIDG